MTQFQITGHSGTAFKHRRAFENLNVLRRKGLKRRSQTHVDEDLAAYRRLNPYSSIDKASRAVKILKFMPLCIILITIAYYFSHEWIATQSSLLFDLIPS